MALGNSNTSAQARGKNKPVVVKRRKEVVAARDYHSFLSTGKPLSSAACGTRASVNQTFYHDGSAAAPAVGDLVYSKRRAGEGSWLPAGYYKITVGRSSYSIQIDSSGAVAARTTC